MSFFVECGQLSYSLKWIAGFLSHQYFWKKSIDILKLPLLVGLGQLRVSYFFSFFIITYTGDKKLQVKKLTLENKTIQLVKPRTKHHPTLTPDKYAYGEVLYITADISNTTLWKAKISEEINGWKVVLEITLKQTYKRKTQR